MRLSKAEVTRRETAIIKWFAENPNATGAVMNEALGNGTITGKKEKLLNIKRVYALRTQVREAIKKAVPAKKGEKPAARA